MALDTDKKSSSSSAKSDSSDQPETSGESESNVDSQFQYTDETQVGKTRHRVSGFFKKKNTLLIGGASGLFAIMLAGVLLFVSSLILPDLGENILLYEFSSVSRNFSEDNTEIISQKAALDTEDNPGVIAKIKATYGTLNDKLLNQFAKFVPDALITKLQGSGELKFNYSAGKFGIKKLTTVTVGDEEIPVFKPSIFDKTFSPIDTFKGYSASTEQISEAFTGLMKDGGVGTLMGSATESALLKQLGYPGYVITNNIFKKIKNGKDEQTDAEVAATQEEEADINKGTPEPSAVSGLESTAQEGDAQIKKDLNNPAKAPVLATTGADPIVEQEVENSTNNLVNGNLATNIFGTVNPILKVALPLCIIYDGSIQSPTAQPTIKANSDEDERSFLFIEGSKDQLESGRMNVLAADGISQRLGDISDSNPIIRASGGTPDTTTDSVSPQTAGNGQFTALNLLLPGVATNIINPVINNACGLVTNLGFEAGLTVVTAASWFASDGATAEAEKAAGQVAEKETKDFVNNVVYKYVSALSSKLGAGETLSSKIALLVGKALPEKAAIKQGIRISGLSFLVNELTYEKMNAINDGLSRGNDLANQGEAGGKLNAQYLEQKQFYGEPLDPSAVTYNKAKDKAYLADLTSSMSIFDRYLSFSNPNSLISKVATTVYFDVDGFHLATIIGNIRHILNPATVIGDIANIIGHKASVSADTVSTDDNTDYGIVEWGYTQQEDSLINNSRTGVSFQPLQNDKIMNDISPSTITYIQNTYGVCYNDDMSVLLTSSPSSGPGAGNYYITRESNGNVVDGANGGRCSDYYLGPNSNDTAIPIDPINGMRDYIFRWRLQQSYDNDMSMLMGIQDAQ